MTGGGLLSARCDINPDFCRATAVHVPYCTGDSHRGNNTEPTSESWGLIFDGHANFARIVKDLQEHHGLSAATHVMLTGGSAGAIGALWNVDHLADQLPSATVKAAPESGWFFPAALPGDTLPR